ncbi:type II toxin-antitoxin system Phd/YefM family antitoxin [Ghiorsea bivora]|uniref:type II toxin-antitoxin system Phd/YefM family antitoxin n=1 Tax=Ghiorsea bivora TaxID=1485545 RepID=UPI00056EF01D|nr:type II toxin-antitoxin system Phd/YefM family antitoxin [Ghiorsea bivora]
MHSLTANELKTRGISSLEEGLKDSPELMITVRGKEKYVVLDIEYYHQLREVELEAALLESRQDITDNKATQESAEAHVQHIFD